jgi:phasin family protein
MVQRNEEGIMASNPRSSDRESGDVAETTRRATEHAARGMSEAGERTTRAGAEAFQRNAERLNVSWRSGSETANRIAERSMEQLSRLFGLSGETARQTVQQTSGNIQAMLESTTIIADGLQELSGEWLRFAQDRLEQNMEHFDQLLGCRSPHDYLALQSRIARENFEAMLQSARRAAERSTRSADEAVRKMSEASVAPQ